MVFLLVKCKIMSNVFSKLKKNDIIKLPRKWSNIKPTNGDYWEPN